MDCNNGSIDGDPAAAMRYTECKLSKYGELLLKDIDKNTVDFIDNYDGTEKEPTSLPGFFPGLLANGSEGIAVGMSTFVPPHNLTEIYNACIFMIDKVLMEEEYTLEEIMKIVKGPDFPWGGVITSLSGLKQAFETGKGKVVVRAKYEINEEKYNKRKLRCIRIKEIPYKENKAKIIEKIENLINNNIIDGIYTIVDETSKEDEKGVNIAIYLKNSANPDIILNKLFKLTGLQKNINYNMNALIDGFPRQVGLITILDEFVSKCLSVLVSKSSYEKDNLLKRLEIVEAILLAKSNVENAIEIIMSSENPKDELKEMFDYTDRQADYIYNMKIRELNNVNIEKLDSEKESLIEKSEELTKIEEDQMYALQVLKEEFIRLKENYGDERRSKIELADMSISEEDLMDDEQLVITISSEYNIKSVSEKEYVSQKRGGKGIKATSGKEDETLLKLFSVNNKDTILFFTNEGRAYFLKAYKIIKGNRTSKGKNIVNYINLEEGEKIIDTIAITKEDKNEFLVMATKNGIVKKMHKDYLPKRSQPLKLITLTDGDEIIGLDFVSDEDDIFLATKNGLCLRYSIKDTVAKGRSARGNKGAKLKEGDSLVAITKVKKGGYIATFTSAGLSKKTEETSFPVKKRGGSTIKGHTLPEGNTLVSAISLSENDDIMVFTSNNRMIRIKYDSITTFGRTATGSKTISMENDEFLVGASVIPKNNTENTEEE